MHKLHQHPVLRHGDVADKAPVGRLRFVHRAWVERHGASAALRCVANLAAGQDYRMADALQAARAQPTCTRWGPERVGPER
jgi:hypothetical protein